MKIVAAKKLLKANDQLAEENPRQAYAPRACSASTWSARPAAGRPPSWKASLPRLKGRLAPAVIEGDIAGSIDAERIEALGVPVVQINTDGACHLDAPMISAALGGLDLASDRPAVGRKRGQPGLHGRVRPGRAPAHRRAQRHRRRRQGGQVSGHLPGLRRGGDHQVRPAAA